MSGENHWVPTSQPMGEALLHQWSFTNTNSRNISWSKYLYDSSNSEMSRWIATLSQGQPEIFPCLSFPDVFGTFHYPNFTMPDIDLRFGVRVHSLPYSMKQIRFFPFCSPTRLAFARVFKVYLPESPRMEPYCTSLG